MKNIWSVYVIKTIEAMENAISLVGITARLCIPGLRRIKSRVISEYFFPAYNIRTYSIYAKESER